MVKSKLSAFNPLSGISVPLKKASAELFKSVARKQIAPISLLAVLGFTGVSWLTTSAIAPQSARAYTARLNVSLNREPGEAFQSFLRRAEAIARAAAQRSFDRDILVTDVAITVVGQNDGAIVPLLSLEVSRQSWRRSPDPQRWVTYFPNTESLLGFEDIAEQPGTQPGGTPQPTPVPGQAIPGGPQQPGGPRVIELPGGNRRVVPGTPQPGTPQPGTPQPGTPQPGTPQPGTPQPGTPQPGTQPAQGTPTQQAPSGPSVIELPGGNRRIVPGSAPAAPAPAAPAPANPGTLPPPPPVP